MFSRRRLICLLLVVVPFSVAVARDGKRDVYRWVDENGVVHYSDRNRAPGADSRPDPLGEDVERIKALQGTWTGHDELGNQHSWLFRRNGDVSIDVVQPGTTWRMHVEGAWKFEGQNIMIRVSQAQLTSRTGDTTGELGWETMRSEVLELTPSRLSMIWNGNLTDLTRNP